MNTLSPSLTQLQSADLIRRLRELEEAYQFKHNLIQESAYASLLKNERRILHRAAARALERAYPHALDENAALLAKHFAEAGDEEKTFAYARRAGDVAARVSAYAEALMHYDTATLLAARLQIPATEFVQVHQQRGRVLELMGRFDDAVEAYRALYALGQTRGEAEIELGALSSLGTLYTFPNNAQNLDEGLRVNRKALELARAAGDGEAEARVLWNMQQHAYFSGRAAEAVAYSKQALALAERLELRALCAYILNDVSRALVSVESVANALKALAEARVIWRETQNLPMLVDNLSSTAETMFVGGDLETAEQFVMEAQQLSQTIGNVWNLAYSSGTRMQMSVLRGETRRGLELHTQIVGLARQSGFVVAEQIADIQRAMLLGVLGEPMRGIETLKAQPVNDAFQFLDAWRVGSIAFLELMRGDLPTARAALAQIHGVVNLDDLSTYGPMYLALCRAQLALAAKRFDDALVEARSMVERLRAVGIYYFLPELVWCQAQAYLGLQEWETAEKFLREAEELARHTQARFVLWEVLAALSEIETRRGNVERAHALKQEAREIIEWLADAAPDDPSPEFGASLRETFLAQEKIRAVWNGLPTDWENG